MPTLACTQCSAPVERRPYHAALTANPFCGFACYAEWQKVHRKGQGARRIEVACTHCGVTLLRIPSAARGRCFCDRACFDAWHSTASAGENNPAWLGGHMQYRGENWRRQAAAARKRDGHACQRCGKAGHGLPVHHKRPFHLFPDYRSANALENLVTLCPSCHGAEEAAFWRDNPDVVSDRRYPDCLAVKACRECGADFHPRSGASLVCDGCCNATCARCGEGFHSRKAVTRDVKYCSCACRNAAIARPEQVCAGCGTRYQPTRPHTRYCGQACGRKARHYTNPRRASSVTT